LNDNHGIELGGLPSPTTQSFKLLKSSADHATSSALHSSIARTVFSLVFVESCMMFLVLMLQGLGRFASACVVLHSLLMGYEESEDAALP